MRVEQPRENAFTLTATSQELAALIAAARMALEAMRDDPEASPTEVTETLERVLADFDREQARLSD